MAKKKQKPKKSKTKKTTAPKKRQSNSRFSKYEQNVGPVGYDKINYGGG